MVSDLIGMAASNTKGSPMQLGCAPRGEKRCVASEAFLKNRLFQGSSAKISLHKEIHEIDFENVKHQYIIYQ